MCATLFLYIGQEVRARRLLEPGVIPGALWVIMLGIWLYCGVFYGQLYMVGNDYYHGLMDIVGAVCGSLCIIKGAMLFEARMPAAAHPLERLGTLTLPIICAHLIEMNVFPWPTAMLAMESLPVPMWLPGLALRFALVAAVAVGLWLLPRPISGLFYPSRRATSQAPTSPAK